MIAMGRLGVDLYPQQVMVPLRDVSSFGKFLGGSAANVAVASARHGRHVGLISRTGADDFGRYLLEELERLGVSTEFIRTVENLPTPITFCAILSPDDFPITFYRYPKAPDMEIRPRELDASAIAGTRLFWITATGLSDEPSRSAHHEALRLRSGAPVTVLDLDYREVFWDDPADATAEVARVLPLVDVVVGNIAECEVAVGETDPVKAGDALLERGPHTAIVKLGPKGALGMDSTGIVMVPPVQVEVLNGLGAGDAFGGALCHGILENWPLEKTLRFANAAGAIVASRLECSTAMPYTDEVIAALPRR